MIASAHVAAGMVIGLASAMRFKSGLGGIAIALSSAVVGHMVLDAIPHSDYHGIPRFTALTIATCEVVAVTAIAFFLVRRRLVSGALGCLAAGLAGSVLPDAKFIAPLLMSADSALRVEHYGNMFHAPFHSTASSPALGMITQVLAAVALLVTFVVLARRLPVRGAQSDDSRTALQRAS